MDKKCLMFENSGIKGKSCDFMNWPRIGTLTDAYALACSLFSEGLILLSSTVTQNIKQQSCFALMGNLFSLLLVWVLGKNSLWVIPSVFFGWLQFHLLSTPRKCFHLTWPAVMAKFHWVDWTELKVFLGLTVVMRSRRVMGVDTVLIH